MEWEPEGRSADTDSGLLEGTQQCERMWKTAENIVYGIAQNLVFPNRTLTVIIPYWCKL